MPNYGGDYYIPNESFAEVIWEYLKGREDDIAIIDAFQDGKSITYLELYDLSRKCAAYLQSLGITKADYIAISASGSVDFICLAIGILGSGAIVAPCNPSYRKSEVLQQFTISSPRIVFVDEEGVETMKAVKAEFPSLDKIFVIGESTEFPTLHQILRDIDPETLTKVDTDPAIDVAFVPHSSGTTGLPKCCMSTHRNCVAECWATSALLNGIKVVTEREFRIDKFFKDIENYKISIAFCVPPMLIEMSNAANSDQYDLSSLKSIIAGGAAMPPDIIQRIMKKYKVTFISGYGSTECGTVSLGVISKGETTEISPSSGKLLKGVELKIMDVLTETECPIETDGEIRIKSPQVIKGYLGNPAANVAAFDRDGWFRTGDIGRLDELGNIYIVDRLKEIIKYKSVQVSPAELESVIIRHPKVADVGVVGIPDGDSEEVPKAFVVSNDSSLSAEDIHKIVMDNLVEYKHLRGGVQFVTSIPKSKTGKIQRNILKKMAGL